MSTETKKQNLKNNIKFSAECDIEDNKTFQNLAFQENETDVVVDSTNENEAENPYKSESLKDVNELTDKNTRAVVYASSVNSGKSTSDKEIVELGNVETPANAPVQKKTFLKAIRTICGNPPFFIYACGAGLAYQSVVMLVIFIQDIFLDAGLTKEDASLALLLINLFSTLGRLIPGSLFQLKCISTFTVPMIASILSTVSLIASYMFTYLALKLVFLCVGGLSLGMFVSMLGVMALRFFDPTVLSTGIGLTMTSFGIAVAVFGPISGKWCFSNRVYMTKHFRTRRLNFIVVSTCMLRIII